MPGHWVARKDNTEPSPRKREGVTTMYVAPLRGEDIVWTAWEHAELGRNDLAGLRKDVLLSVFQCLDEFRHTGLFCGSVFVALAVLHI